MDNALIHIYIDIDELITFRGYRSIYLPPYSPQLNPIEQFWSVVNNKVKRGTFSDNEDLKTRIAEVCNNVLVHHLKDFIQALL
jgi:transposase